MGVIKATFLTHPGATYAQPESNLVFGSACTILLALLSVVLTLWFGQSNPLPLMLGACCLLLLLWSPASFTPFNRAWRATSVIFSQVIIVFVWLFYILPTGILMQARGKDPLHLRFQPEARTYWKRPLPTTNMQKSS